MHHFNRVTGTSICNVFCFNPKDIAVDGWVLTILTKDYLSYGPATQTVGMMFGSLIAYNFFIPLNSQYFCNTYLFSTPREVELFFYLTDYSINRLLYYQSMVSGRSMHFSFWVWLYSFISLSRKRSSGVRKLSHLEKLLKW